MKLEPGEKLPATAAILTLVGFGMRPEEVTESLGVEPGHANVSPVRRCDSGRKDDCGLWCYDTAQHVSGDDIEKHLEHLILIFRPLISRMEEIRPRPNIFVHLRCAPASRLRPLVTPRLNAKHVAAIAELGAALTIELIEERN